jgi:dipeptidyl aminopeptidase/acylaminoacyl peptidase
MKDLKHCIAYPLLLIAMALLFSPALGQDKEDIEGQIEQLNERLQYYRHSFNELQKSIDDGLWFDRLGDIAIIDKVNIVGPPKSKQQTPNETAQGAGNPFRFPAYVFIPQDYDPGSKYPLLVFPHGGVHSDFNTFYIHIIRELMAQGYVVVAPEYRGSTGYGRSMYEAIDYGGLEVEDTYASRNFMVENYDMIDEKRIGILGWSHGGLHTLLNIFRHPDAYKVAYAGVPVSDLVARMGYKTQGYRDLYSADFHIGKSAYEDVEEYIRRSPARQAEKLETPLLIHTTTNDGDVNVLEVRHLIQALKAEDKDFEYKIYEDAPGGHTFNRLDTKLAKESRLEIYKFLAEYLSPDKPLQSIEEMMKVSYKLK